jgi:hypothetical protein
MTALEIDRLARHLVTHRAREVVHHCRVSRRVSVAASATAAVFVADATRRVVAKELWIDAKRQLFVRHPAQQHRVGDPPTSECDASEYTRPQPCSVARAVRRRQ